jgi:hypothetical protein
MRSFLCISFYVVLNNGFRGHPGAVIVVSLNLDQGEVHKFVSDLQQVGGFLRVLWFPPAIKLTATI